MDGVRPATHVVHAVRLTVDEPEDEEYSREHRCACVRRVRRHEDGQPEGDERHEQERAPHQVRSVDATRFLVQLTGAVQLEEREGLLLPENKAKYTCK